MIISSSAELDLVEEIALSFLPFKYTLSVKRIDHGIVNKTFLISPLDLTEFKPFVLQAVSSQVFKKPIDLILNYLVLEECLIENNSLLSSNKKNSLILPNLLVNVKTNKKYIFYQGKLWRAFDYVYNTTSYYFSSSSDISFNLGKGLSIFHKYTSVIRSESLLKVVHDFHNTPVLLTKFNSILASYVPLKSCCNDYKYFHKLVSEVKRQESDAYLLEEAKQLKYISFGVIHGDPKISNFLFDSRTNNFVSLIDLDTVQAGFFLYDLADCLRSSCNPLGEDTKLIENITFSLEHFKEVLLGYFSEHINILNKYDILYLAISLRVITYELSIRFLIDHMNGNKYFNVTYPSQNLYRADVQLRLLASINDQWGEIIAFTNYLVSSKL